MNWGIFFLNSVNYHNLIKELNTLIIISMKDTLGIYIMTFRRFSLGKRNSK